MLPQDIEEDAGPLVAELEGEHGVVAADDGSAQKDLETEAQKQHPPQQLLLSHRILGTAVGLEMNQCSSFRKKLRIFKAPLARSKTIAHLIFGRLGMTETVAIVTSAGSLSGLWLLIWEKWPLIIQCKSLYGR